MRITDMRMVIALLAVVVLAGSGFWPPALASEQALADNSGAQLGRESADPGRSQREGVVGIDYTRYWPLAGLRLYYELYGKWPASWAAVVEAGLFDAELVTTDGTVLDLDDPSLDFYFDMHYIPPTGDELRACLVYALDADAETVKNEYIDPPATIREKLFWQSGTLAGNKDEVDSVRYITESIKDREWLRRVAIGSMLQRGISLYKFVHGHLPYSWEEYVASGLAPITAESINPFTGNPYRGDGSAGDYLYRYVLADETNIGTDAYKFTHVDQDGSEPIIRLMY